MPSNATPLPVKWYFASFVGALVLAFILMTVLEIRATDPPRRKHEIQANDENDPKQDARSTSRVVPAPVSNLVQHTSTSSKTALEQSRPKSPPSDLKVPPETRTSPPPPPPLWSLIVSPALIAIAAVIVALGAFAALLRTVQMKRRGHA